MEITGRAGLPLLAAGQTQKESWHNEALLMLDLLTGAMVASGAGANPPAAPEPGLFYQVASSPSGAWSGHSGELAAWTAGGWRFVTPFDGLRLTEVGSGIEWLRADGAWQVGVVTGTELRIAGDKVVGERGAAIASPSGGTTVDTEARACLGAVLSTLRGHGLIEI